MFGIALGLALLGVPGVTAQTPPQLSDRTIQRPLVGLTATLPLGASVKTLQIAGTGVNSIQLPDMAALINVSDRRLAEPKSLSEVADAIVRENLATVSTLRIDGGGRTEQLLETAKGRVLSRETRQVGGWPAEVFYLELDSPGGTTQGRGYAVFMPTPTAVALFELQANSREMVRARPYFELLVESARIVDPVAAEARRALGVENAIAFFGDLTPADYERVIEDLGDEWRFERFYRPAATGSDADADELGYRRTRFTLGVRGDLKSREERRGSSPEDRERGYLVFQEARLLHDGQIVDVSAGFFMTPDRREETWIIRQTIRPTLGGSRAATTTVVETGIRDRADPLITRSVGGKPGDSITPGIEGQGYISRLEVYLMPYLLHARGEHDTVRAYAYNPTAERVTLREDHFRPRDEGGFVYTSSPSEGSPGQTVLFDSRGEPIRADLPGDQVWEPISLQRLFELWREKRLPLE